MSYDLESGQEQLWDHGEQANAGEPVHVADPDSGREEDGYLMCFVHNPPEGAFLSIIRAGRVAEGPVAKIHIPVRVPNGFHANWMQGMALS
jgi:carotenoid cleavage dioxygenase